MDHPRSDQADVADARRLPHTRRVLVIEDDAGIAETWRWILRPLQVELCWAPRGLDALAAARRTRFDLVLVDLRLPDIPGMDVVRTLRVQDARLRFVVISGYVTLVLAQAAFRLGALGVLEKPVSEEQMFDVVRSALDGTRPHVNPEPPDAAPLLAGSVVDRWAQLVLRAMQADHDLKTLDDWTRCVGISRSALCECCRLVHVPPRDARNFVRMLRAIAHSGERWQPETVLDFADVRTLNKLLEGGGLQDAPARTPTPLEFLARQRWIPPDNPALLTLKTLIAAADPPPSTGWSTAG